MGRLWGMVDGLGLHGVGAAECAADCEEHLSQGAESGEGWTEGLLLVYYIYNYCIYNCLSFVYLQLAVHDWRPLTLGEKGLLYKSVQG